MKLPENYENLDNGAKAIALWQLVDEWMGDEPYEYFDDGVKIHRNCVFCHTDVIDENHHGCPWMNAMALLDEMGLR